MCHWDVDGPLQRQHWVWMLHSMWQPLPWLPLGGALVSSAVRNVAGVCMQARAHVDSLYRQEECLITQLCQDRFKGLQGLESREVSKQESTLAVTTWCRVTFAHLTAGALQTEVDFCRANQANGSEGLAEERGGGCYSAKASVQQRSSAARWKACLHSPPMAQTIKASNLIQSVNFFHCEGSL